MKIPVFLLLPAMYSILTATADVPKTKVSPTTDTYHGVEVPDPYRWLEDWSDDAVKSWTAAQTGHARQYLDSRPNVEAIRRRVTEILSAETVSYAGVQVRGDRFFSMKSAPPKQQSFIITFDSLTDLSTARVLVDPETIDPTGGTTIDWYEASPDGKTVYLSPILSWFAGDFGKDQSTRLRTISSFVPASAQLAIQQPGVKLSYLDYDWSLNDQE